MKRICLILALCLALTPACVAETSPADDFVSGLSQAWGALTTMANDAGKSVSEWAQGAASDISAWADQAGLTEWAQGAAKDIDAWFRSSGISEWAEGAAKDLQAFVDENGPAVEAWLNQAGEEVRQAWDTLVNAGQHTREEIEAARDVVVGALEEADSTGSDDSAANADNTDSAANADSAGHFTYEHDPRDNPNAMKDIVVNPDAVYGFSPSPDSTRLKEYVDAIDWTNPEQVAKARAQRQAYHDSISELYRMIEDMLHKGKNVEEIARAVSTRRNEIRLETYKDDPEIVKKSNLETYGNELGPTPDELYEKYGSWQKVLERALGTNAGMDACLGFYDEYYDMYDIE